MPLENFPESLKQGILKRELTAKFNKEEEDIIEKFNYTSIPDNKIERLIKEQLHDLPILVYSFNVSERMGQLSKFICIANNHGVICERRILKHRLNCIIIFLKACHLQFSQYLLGKFPERNEEIGEEAFFNWIKSLMVEPIQYKNPPIFGNYVVLKDNHYNHDDVCSEDFSEPQIALIKYFSSSKYASMIIHLSLSLIYYWYKDKQNPTFMEVFSDEQIYWDTMISVLENKFL
jgi:hypothetical protein